MSKMGYKIQLRRNLGPRKLIYHLLRRKKENGQESAAEAGHCIEMIIIFSSDVIHT